MEELKNGMEEIKTEEPVIEQRPSTKYGRTAYQQQLQQEQTAKEEERMEQEQTAYQEQPWIKQNSYQQTGWQNPYQAYASYEEEKPAVKDTYVRVLMALIAVATLAGFVMNVMSSEAYNMTDSIEGLMDAILLIAEQPKFQAVSMVVDIATWTIIGFLIVDVMQFHKAEKKIGGLIFFAIFLRPAYFIWRAHLLGQKKKKSIIYAAAIYTVSIVQYAILFSGAMDMVMRTM